YIIPHPISALLHSALLSAPSYLFFFHILYPPSHSILFFFNAPATTEIYTLSLHDALPISRARAPPRRPCRPGRRRPSVRCTRRRSEEHTSELQSPYDLVCRLLLEKKKKKNKKKKKKYTTDKNKNKIQIQYDEIKIYDANRQ